MPTSEPAQRGSASAPTRLHLLARPLEFISEDHLRERQICAVIDTLATARRFHPQDAMAVLRFLNEERNLHRRDEMEDLFPLLARRCTAEDAIDKAIARIRAEQNAALRLLPAVRAILLACLDGGVQLGADERGLLSRFAGQVRRHLVAENAILLPMARARLTRADLRILSKHMRSRRGLPDLRGDT